VAAAVGHSVLKALAEEELVERGLQSMDYLYNKLMELQSKHHFIGI
jgi:4-aminobutyrate aminotransferase-like enzyme